MRSSGILQISILLHYTYREGNWIGHSLKKTEGTIEKEALNSNLQGVSRKSTRKTWERSVEEATLTIGKTCSEVKTLTVNREGKAHVPGRMIGMNEWCMKTYY